MQSNSYNNGSRLEAERVELSNPIYPWRDVAGMQAYTPYSGGLSPEQMQFYLAQSQMSHQQA